MRTAFFFFLLLTITSLSRVGSKSAERLIPPENAVDGNRAFIFSVTELDTLLRLWHTDMAVFVKF